MIATFLSLKSTECQTFFIDLNEIHLALKTKLVKSTGAATADETVGVVKNFLHPMIKNIEVEVGSTNVFNSNQLNPYIAFIHKLLTTKKEVFDNRGGAFGWVEDTVEKVSETKCAGLFAGDN